MSQKPKMPWLSRGALAVLVGTLLFGIVAPASAQFFGFGGPPEPQQRPQPRERQRERGFGWFGGNDTPFFAPFQQQAPKRQAPREDYSRAPASERRDSTAERNVLVLGDSMADWLGYGLDDAYSEQPDMGVIRKHKTVSGLLRYQPKGDPADWAAAAKGILATEKPDAIVVMLGLSDRIAIREPDKADKKGKLRPDGTSEPTSPADDSDQDIADPGSIAAPERGARNAAGGVADFRDDRWGELYSKKIEEMIAVVKASGVPVLWVGLPAVRGTKATSDMLYLNSLYRDAAGKAGITYVDVWDGFVDEGGRFLQQGPDFEGQIRRLRSYDGVYFTRAGARKLAHYVEREITRLMAARTGPVALPSEPATPDANAVPGAPPPRPLAGPIVPLVASIVGTDQLLGGPGVRPVAADPLATRTLVKGEPLSAPAGRADDFAWPRREVGREQARGEPVATIAPASPTSASLPGPDGASTTAAPAAPKLKPKPKPVAAIDPPAPSGIGSFFGFDEPRRAQPVQPQRPPASVPRNGPRPANGGPSAAAPGFFMR